MIALRTLWGRGGTVLIGIYALSTLSALVALSPLYAALAGALHGPVGTRTLVPTDLAVLLEVAMRTGRSLAHLAKLGVLAVFLGGPVLTVALANALAFGSARRSALRAGLVRCVSAALARLVCVLAFAAGAALLYLLASALAGAGSEALELPVRLALVASVATWAAVCATSHDAALASLAVADLPFSRTLSDAIRALSVRLCALRAAAALGVIAFTMLADLAGRLVWPVPRLASQTFSIALSQLMLLCALSSRGLFLQYVVRRALPALSPQRP